MSDDINILSNLFSIKPIREKDAETVCLEFFSEEFRSQRSGSLGMWAGSGMKLWDLADPVPQKQFLNLVQGLNPTGTRRVLFDGDDPDRIALLQVTMSASRDVSVLWGLASESARENIESAHAMAAHGAVSVLNRTLGERMSKFTGKRSATLAAYFMSGATADQTPHLHSTAFLVNHAFCEDGSAKAFSREDIRPGHLVCANGYRLVLEDYLSEALGVLRNRPSGNDLRLAGVSQQLVHKFFSDQTPGLRGLRSTTKPLKNEELFQKWRAQAKSFGWGAKEASALLRQMKRDKFWSDVKSRVSLAGVEARGLLENAKRTWGEWTNNRTHQHRDQGKEKKQRHTQSR